MRTRRGVYGLLAAEVALVVWYSLSHDPFDLKVYLWGGRMLPSDLPLYLTQVSHHWFTYPPFAAALFWALDRLPVAVARLLWQLGSIACLAWAAVLTIRLAGYRPTRTAVAAVVAVSLLLEPMYHTLFLGQVNIYLFALVLYDVWLTSQGRLAGIGVGIAAAIKLTPAIFGVFFLVTGRIKAALTALGAFAACGLIAYLIAPRASRLYWSRLFYDTRRVYAAYVSNQSPYGAVLRIWGGDAHAGSWYPVLPVLIAIAGLAVAVVLARHGDWLGAASVTGVSSLLVSPISWTHHWVWILPALALLLRDGRRLAAACGFLLFAFALPWWTPPFQSGFHGLVTVVANSYLIAGLAFFAYMAGRAYLALRPGGPRAAPGTTPSARPAESPAPYP